MAKEKNPANVKRGRAAKRKGACGEREAANKLTELFNVDCHRGRQYHGGPGTPDIVSESEDPNKVLSGVHFEIKRTESLSLYTALDQAIKDAKDNIPVVLHRRSRKPWLCILELDKLPNFIRLMYPYLKDIADEKNSSS